MIRGVWLATVHGVVKSWTRLKRLSTAALAARIGANVQLNSYPSAFEKGDSRTLEDTKTCRCSIPWINGIEGLSSG